MSLYEIQFDFPSLKHKLVTIHDFDNNDGGYLATKSIDWAVALAFFLTVYLCRAPCYSKYVWFASCQFCDCFDHASLWNFLKIVTTTRSLIFLTKL